MEKRPRPLRALVLSVGLVIAVSIGALCLSFLSSLIPKETSDQARQRQAAAEIAASDRQRAAATLAAQTERERSLCKQADVCRRYGAARQDCAAAGDIRACIEIKMKGDSGTYCTGDGGLSYAVPDLPNRVRCAVLSWD